MLHVYCTGLLALIPKLMYCGIIPLCVSVEEGCGEKREEKRVVLHRSTGNSVPLPQMCPNSGLAISFGLWYYTCTLVMITLRATMQVVDVPE